ncbi:MAG TPA: MG2 domain-containing protein, partial [Opitutaceae bacterium]|nr:MG2 domain-containing protein [Opitutaceae bacterium]
LAWHPETTDPRASTYKAIRLYQKLLAYHDADEDRAAFDDADLARLMFGHNAAVGDDKDARYESALARFAEETSRREISARARAALATQWQRHDDPARAHAEAERGFRAFPKTAGGAMCFNVIRQIEAPSARLSTERVWNAPWPTLDVTYRNVTHVYFRAIAVNFEDYVSRRRWNIGGIDRRDLGGWLEQTPALAWDGELPATRDYRERVEKLPAPKTLRPGFYMVVASYDRNFERGDNEVSATTLWVSDLALVVRTNRDSAAGDGLLVTADEGNPVAGATVRFWQQDKQGWLKPAGDTKTDDAGRFNLPVGRATVALAESGGQAVSTAQEVYLYRSHETDTDHTQVVFFTDRSIYRPGQVINFKGIAIHFDSKSGNYGVEPDKTLTVVFNDPNGKEITRVAVQTNDYGSFSGVFTAPRDRLTGMMQLRVLEENGATGVRVEEYKRPKFYVEVKPPSVAPRLGQPVAVTGVATAYTGAAIGGAKVAWRIERRVQLPPWCWWWSPPQVKAIAHGTAVTEPDGTFTVRFTAEPDRTVPAENEPVFAFQVHADVTDTAGETRSDDRTLRIGYMALEASLSADSWQTVAHPVELDVGTKSLDGDPEPAKGKLTVYALQQPVVVARAALGTRRYFAPLNPGARVPTQPKYDPANVDTWPLGARVVSRDVATDAKGSAHVAVLLPVGIYRAMLETQDRFGRKVTAQRTIQVLSPGNPHYGIKLADELAAPRWSAEPGETFTALWGTGYATGRAFVEIECNGRPIRS